MLGEVAANHRCQTDPEQIQRIEQTKHMATGTLLSKFPRQAISAFVIPGWGSSVLYTSIEGMVLKMTQSERSIKSFCLSACCWHFVAWPVAAADTVDFPHKAHHQRRPRDALRQAHSGTACQSRLDCHQVKKYIVAGARHVREQEVAESHSMPSIV